MSIVSSTLDIGEAQADGRRYVTERHTAADGDTFDFSYLADVSVDCGLVLSARADVINDQLAAREAAQALVVGTTLPLSPYAFLLRMTPAERIGIRMAAKSDLIVEDFMDMLNRASVVFPQDPMVAAGLQYLVSIGRLTTERAGEIGVA